MLKEFWKNITNRGVTPDLDFNVRNKIRIFNSSTFVIGSTYLFYTVMGIIQGDYIAATLTFSSWAISAFCLYLMSRRNYTLAYHVTAILGIVFLFTFCMLYGEATLTHAYFFFIPVASIVLFDNFKICFYYFIATLLVIVGTKLWYLNFKPYYEEREITIYLGFLNITLAASLVYLAVRMFKHENLIYSKEINAQRDIIEEKNKDIVSSIHYAKRIQKALLASDNLLDKHLPQHFVLYKPKDIVSGDFYWGEMMETKFLLCTADCTGHGVPGAFMSLLGVSFLNEIVRDRNITEPNLIFNHLRDDIIKVLNPEGTLEEGKDGMDAVMCSFDFTNMNLVYAGANNPIWIVRENELIEFKPDKQPIGMYEFDRKPFTQQTIQLQKNDMVYSFTDGYADQFGGEKGKKFKYKQLQDILIQNASKPMNMQHNALEKIIEDWKGNLDQVDDILLIGVRII